MPLSAPASGLIDHLVSAGFRPFHQMTVEEARAGMAALFLAMGPGPASIAVSDHLIGVDGGTIGARLYLPEGPPAGLIVYYHGGGWTLGTLTDYDGFARRLASATGCAVLLSDYRLAPEHRFPVPVTDAVATLDWADAYRSKLGVEDVPLFVAGDSAGGALAAVAARKARDAGAPLVEGQILLCPVVQSERRFPSQDDAQCQVVISREDMEWFWDHYAPEAPLRKSPDASPLLADNLAGLPPALVLTAEYDVNRDEGEAYAQRLTVSGVPVLAIRHEGEFHAFAVFGALPSSDEALAEIVEFLKDIVSDRSPAFALKD